MALSADKKTEYREGVELSVPVSAGDKIYSGGWVCFGADGYLVPGADTAGLIFAGLAREYVDNSGGSDGDLNCKIRRRGLVKALLGNTITIANVGDSRAYRLRKGRFAQLTRDHSVVSELIEKGHIEPEEALDHEASGQLPHYVGMETKARSHVRSFDLKKADRILLCTDGLTDMLADKKIAAILKAETDPQAACKSLVAAANEGGGHDNITALIIDWLRSS